MIEIEGAMSNELLRRAGVDLDGLRRLLVSNSG